MLASAAVLGASAALAGSASYVYDSLGRLATVTYSNGVVITYVYDAAGNRMSFTVTGAPAAPGTQPGPGTAAPALGPVYISEPR